MKRFFRNLSAILTVVLINSFSLATHTVAMPMPAHEMQGMNHGSSSSSLNCATLCRTAVINKEDLIAPIDNNEEDDEAELPYYAQYRTLQFADPLTKEKRYAEAVRPPPKTPVYILYGVFRV